MYKSAAYSLSRLMFAVAPLLILYAAWLQVMLPTDSDKGWLLYAARKLITGGRLGVDIIEVNPPLIVWLYAIPSWVSLHVKGLQDFEALGLMGLGFALGSALLSRKIIRSHPAFAGNPAFQFRFLLLVGMVFVYFTTQVFFFDREHLFFMLAFPYMLRLMPSLLASPFSLTVRLTIGALAALGFCIKPHTLIVFALLQLYLVVRRRSLRAVFMLENAVIASLALCYLAAVIFFMPEYLHVILPMAAATYADFGVKSGKDMYMTVFFTGVFLIFSQFRIRQATPYRQDIYYFGGVLAAFLLYALANNGWGYTYNPLFCMLLFLAGWVLWEFEWLLEEYRAHGFELRRLLYGLRGCALVLVSDAGYMLVYLTVIAFNVGAIRTPCVPNAPCWRTSVFLTYAQENHVRSFGTMTFDFSNWLFLVRETGAAWDTRFNHLWMLPKLLMAPPEYVQAHRAIVEYVAGSLAEDMNLRKPEIMIVDHSPAILNRPHELELVRFLSVLPAFRQAWSQYRYAETLDECSKKIPTESSCRYDIFRRVTSR